MNSKLKDMELNKGLTTPYSIPVRWLHAGVAAGAVFQLLTSLILLPPDEKGSAFAHAVMETHEISGLVVAAFVAAHLLWSIRARGDQHASLRILFSFSQWREAFSLIKTLASILFGKTNMPEPGNSLARIVEMMGILVMVAIAVTGVAMWFILPENSLNMSPTVDLLMNIHSLLSNLLWVYVIGHVFMVWAHIRAGDPVIQRVSPF